MKKVVLVLAMAAAFAPAAVLAEAGDIVVRLRATHIAPDEDSKLGSQTDSSYGPGAANLVYDNSGAELRVDSNTIPEIDLSYYITKNIAAELILALGTRHDVKISGLGSGAVVTDPDLGKVNLLPPTLTLQWHFLPDQMFDPYVGAGVTYVRALDRNLRAQIGPGSSLPIHIDRNSFGAALQAGIDVNLQNRWLINFDVKKLWFDTDVTLDTNGAIGTAGFKKIDSLDVNPWVISAGVGKKF